MPGLSSFLTLGINYSQMHDSSACIVRDGELLFAITEERISRVKHDARFPRYADSGLSRFPGVQAARLDESASVGPILVPHYRHDWKCYASGWMPL